MIDIDPNQTPDTHSDIMPMEYQDYVPGQFSKLYPYKAVKINKDSAILKPNTLSIVRITQDSVLEFRDLKTDEQGHKYIEALTSLNASTGISSNISSQKNQERVRTTKSFEVMAFDFEFIDSDAAIFFTLEKPYDKELYDNEKQIMYYATDIEEGYKDRFEKLDDDEKEWLLANIKDRNVMTMILQDLTFIIDDNPNSAITFTFNLEWGSHIKNTDTLRVQFDKHALVHSIGGRGIVKVAGKEQGYSNICFYSQQKLTPFKMSPITEQSKLTMAADWFDYNVAMPWFMANKMKGNDGATLQTIILNDDDRRFIEDALLISAGFAQSWRDAPRYSIADVEKKVIAKADVGQIKADYLIGHNATSVYTIANKKPQEVIDGLFQDHLNRNPSILTFTQRMQTFRAVIMALSEYIYSSLCAGGGGNAFHKAYLPWYLDIHGTNALNLSANPQKIVTPVGDEVQSWMLIGTKYSIKPKGLAKVNEEIEKSKMKFITRSVYFRENFTNKVDLKPNNTLLLPTKVNISDVLQVQADRKLTLPDVPSNLEPIDKVTLPGDLDLESNRDLKYLFFLNVNTQDAFQKLYLQSGTGDLVLKQPGDVVDVFLPNGDPYNTKTGNTIVWTQEQTDIRTLQLQPGKIIVPSVITVVWSHNFNVTKWLDERFMPRYLWAANKQSNIPVPDVMLKLMLLYVYNWSYAKWYIKPYDWGYPKPGKPGEQIFRPTNAYYLFLRGAEAREWAKKVLPYINIVSNDLKYTPTIYVILRKWRQTYNGRPIRWTGRNVPGTGRPYYNARRGGGRMYLTLEQALKSIDNYVSGTSSLTGSFTYQVAHGEFLPAQVELKETTVVQAQNYDNRQNLFDKLDWIRMLESFKVFPGQNSVFELKIDQDIEVVELQEIHISALWGDSFTLQFNNESDAIKFRMLNRDDESVGMQTIAIY